jgi:hypothetical protein
MVQILVAAGADFTTPMLKDRTTPGYSPSMVAVQQGHVEVLQHLLDSSVDINGRERTGLALIHIATRGNQLRCVEALIAAGADVDVAVACGTSTHSTGCTQSEQAPACCDAQGINTATPLWLAVRVCACLATVQPLSG